MSQFASNAYSIQKASQYDQSQDNYFQQKQAELQNELAQVKSGSFQNDLVEKTSNLPVQDHIQKLEVMLSELVNDLEVSKKTMTMMRGDMLNVEYLEAENNQGISQLIQDETIRVSKAFKKAIEEQQNTFKDYVEQIKQIREDRKVITNKANLIQHRIHESESNVGFKEAYALKDLQQE